MAAVRAARLAAWNNVPLAEQRKLGVGGFVNVRVHTQSRSAAGDLLFLRFVLRCFPTFAHALRLFAVRGAR